MKSSPHCRLKAYYRQPEWAYLKELGPLLHSESASRSAWKGSQIHPHNRGRKACRDECKALRAPGSARTTKCASESSTGTTLDSAMREHGNYHAKSKP